MPAPRPKLLSVITIPTGGWVMKLYVDNGGSFNLAVTFTLAAGDYFMSGDNQSDDFLQEYMAKAYAALDACAAAAYNSADAAGKPLVWIDDTTHKVKFTVGDDENMRFAWTEEDGASIAAVLGVDSSADDDFTGTTLTSDWHHSYGWYADEDGLLADNNAEDIDSADTRQSFAPSGQSKAIYVNSTYSNSMKLDVLPAKKTWSAGVSYSAAPTYPYERNEPLECWWREARQGRRFRVYQYNQKARAKAEHRGTATGATTTTLTDTGKAWDQEPFELAGKVLQIDELVEGPQEWWISSHTGTVISVSNSLVNSAINLRSSAYAIFDRRYRTYVVDLQRMSQFAPRGFQNIDRYSITIPLRRYVA